MLNDIIEEMLNGAARRAIHTTRYSRHAVHRVETVAEHVYNAMIYSSVIAHHLSEFYKIDMGLVLNKTLWHDIEESSGLGDILRCVKHSTPELHQALEALGKQFVSQTASRLEMYNTLVKYWEEAKDSSIEGQIVRVADVLSVVAYLIEEHKLGNRTLDSVYEEVRIYLFKVAVTVETQELKELVHEVRDYFQVQIRVPERF